MSKSVTILSPKCHKHVTICHRDVTDWSTNLSRLTRCHGDVTTCHSYHTRGDLTRHGRGVLFCVTAQTINVITRRHVSRYSFKLHKPSIRSRVCSQSSLLSVFVVAGKTHNVDLSMSCPVDEVSHVSQDCHRDVMKLSRHVTDMSRHVTEMSRLSHTFVTSCNKLSQRPSH